MSTAPGGLRVAVLQATGVVGDAAANLARVRSAAREAAGAGADLLLTPELFVSGYAPARVGDDDGAAHRRAVAGIARETGIAVVASTVERDGDARHICASLVDAAGEEVTRYRKSFLFGAEEEAVFIPGGAAPEVVALNGVTVALGICFDVEFPEFTRPLARRGVQLLLVPTAVPGPGSGQFSDPHRVPELLVPARALENGLTLAYANHHGPEFTGSSSITDPFGAPLARAPRDAPALLLADVAAADSDRARAEVPYLDLSAGRTLG
ncbi:nitrilase-related carbon-nitrogen hydrolase [Kineococcus gynurae]|uniref:Nitrilase-related carbon-nitrogen hydrolase n=1 Tax=Kineococcus gynurae TaxID=452979 RepID=A0ABV5LS77_9ACTN